MVTGPLIRYSVTNEVTFLSNDVTDSYFLFRVTDQVKEVTFFVRYSVLFGPLLNYSTITSGRALYCRERCTFHYEMEFPLY